MTSFRDIKREARRGLHNALQVPALYLVATGDAANPWAITPISVRVHSNVKALGDMAGTNFHYAETQEIIPRVIFMRAEIAMPERLAIVSVAAGEAYCIDNAMPPDDITITAEVSRVTNAVQLAALPVPVA